MAWFFPFITGFYCFTGPRPQCTQRTHSARPSRVQPEYKILLRGPRINPCFCLQRLSSTPIQLPTIASVRLTSRTRVRNARHTPTPLRLTEQGKKQVPCKREINSDTKYKIKNQKRGIHKGGGGQTCHCMLQNFQSNAHNLSSLARLFKAQAQL